MAQRNLLAAADAAERRREVGRRLAVTGKEVESWRKAAQNVYIAYEPALGIHKQASQFTDHEVWDFEHTRRDQYPLFLHFPYFDLYSRQVIKQADLVLAMHLRGDAFTADEKARNFAYYEALTVRDSSLSSCTQAIIAAEVGHLQLAHDYLGEAALMDLHDLEHNVRDGVHMGSLAGAWLAAVHGLGGMRHHGDALEFRPRLPRDIARLSFRILFRGRSLMVAFTHGRVTYRLIRGRPLTFNHYGEPVRVTAEAAVIRTIPRLKAPPEPKQPAGREPVPRGRTAQPRKLRPRRPLKRRAKPSSTGGQAA
jgi:alpha,alpha-trehalose phosphorylase